MTKESHVLKEHIWKDHWVRNGIAMLKRVTAAGHDCVLSRRCCHRHRCRRHRRRGTIKI